MPYGKKIGSLISKFKYFKFHVYYFSFFTTSTFIFTSLPPFLFAKYLIQTQRNQPYLQEMKWEESSSNVKSVQISPFVRNADSAANTIITLSTAAFPRKRSWKLKVICFDIQTRIFYIFLLIIVLLIWKHANKTKKFIARILDIWNVI